MHDRSRDLLQDPPDDLDDEPDDDLDDEEVWFDAEALAAASTIDLSDDLAGDLGSGDHLQRSSALDLAGVIASPGISLARLPGWPQAGAAGQGLGSLADELIGELRPGDLLLLGGRERGIGRSSLLAQLGDGLALASESGRPVTPVLWVVDGAPALWRARSVGRFFDVDPRLFIDGARARREPRCAALLDQFVRGPWAQLDTRQRFVARQALAEVLRGEGERGRETVGALRRWQRSLSEDTGELVWPIVIVDPLEQLSDRAGLPAMLEQLAALARAEGWIVLASCDLDPHDAGWARAIDCFVSVRLRALAVDERNLALELCHRRLGPRGRGQLRWHRASGRFEAIE